MYADAAIYQGSERFIFLSSKLLELRVAPLFADSLATQTFPADPSPVFRLSLGSPSDQPTPVYPLPLPQRHACPNSPPPLRSSPPPYW
jgi:hypothetical protein